MIANVACTGCGCVCDDLQLTVQGGRIVQAEGACALVEPRLLAADDAEPIAEIAGQRVSLGQAIARSAAILRAAHYPLIYGLAQSTTEGQRAAIELAERLGAIIDTAASTCHAPSVMAQQLVGKPTCTLGEVKNRAELVVCWASDPLTTHPRHWERYSVLPPGRRVPRGRLDRFVVVADTRRTPSAEAADLFLQVEPGRHFEALEALRAALRGTDADRVGAASAWTLLARRMKQAACGVVFFGVDLARGEAGHCNVQALLQLVAELNDQGRWYVMRMRVHGNVVGADTVMTWQTGYPFAVNMARDYPRYNPGEYSVQDVLERGDVDACLLVGSETLDWLSQEAREHLRRIPTVLLAPPGGQSPAAPTVRIRSATPGIHVAGTAYRMDGVPIPLRAVLPSRFPADAEVLRAIGGQV